MDRAKATELADSFFSQVAVELSDGRVGRFGEVAAPFQLEYVRAAAPAVLAAAGLPIEDKVEHNWLLDQRCRGASKTTDSVLLTLLWAFVTQSPRRAMILSGDQDQSRVWMQVAASILRLNKALRDRLAVQATRIVSKASGAVAEAVTADAPTTYGALVDLLAVDELTSWAAGGEAVWVAAASGLAKRQQPFCWRFSTRVG